MSKRAAKDCCKNSDKRIRVALRQFYESNLFCEDSQVLLTKLLDIKTILVNTRNLVTIIVVIFIVVLGIVYGSQLYTAPPGPQIKLDVTPNGIPVSGSWSVTSRLVLPGNATQPYVNSTVTMTALLKDG